jgi:2-polyprenyl-6-methoxyphenol hydroxylase-like FAD-dependent oxidoreductase
MKHSTANLLVAVVGAGPIGLTAAVELSRMGVDVRIVNKAPEMSTTSRALGVQARTIELLRPRGVGDEMLRLGNRAHATALHAAGRRLAGIEFSRMPSEFNLTLMLAQSETERLLAEQLGRQGIKVERSVQFVSLVEHSDSVTVTLAGPDGITEVVQASHVIAADGSHSPVRKALGLPLTGRSLPQNYVLGDLSLSGEIREYQLSIFLAPKGFLAVFPMGDKRFQLDQSDRARGTDSPGTPRIVQPEGPGQGGATAGPDLRHVPRPPLRQGRRFDRRSACR